MDEHLEYYRTMLQIRLFEEKIDWLFSRDMIEGTSHLCIGQEAVAVGAISAIRSEDYVVSTHRGHGHLIAKGARTDKLMAELMGKGTGYCRGKGGSQHISIKEISFLGTNGITGGGIPVATGAALSMKLQNIPRIVLSFFGDGASNQGTFHESLNMASLWKLPIVYICENNLYGMSMPVNRSTSVTDIANRAVAYNMPGKIVDGMDLFAVRETVKEAADNARNGKGPTLIEAKTYRFKGHSKSDQRKYRTREEENAWKQKDSIITFRKYLIARNCEESEIEEIEASVREEIEMAVEFAQKSSYAPDAAAFEGSYSYESNFIKSSN